MIFVDSNYFVRYFTQGETSELTQQSMQAIAFFEQFSRGEIEITTSEVVFHEVAFVLTSKATYGLSVDQVVGMLSSLLRKRNFRLPPGAKQRYERALELWSIHNTLGLADCIVAATVVEMDVAFATFDTHFTRLNNIAIWRPNQSK